MARIAQQRDLVEIDAEPGHRSVCRRTMAAARVPMVVRQSRGYRRGSRIYQSAGFLGAGPAPAGLNAPGIILLGGAVLALVCVASELLLSAAIPWESVLGEARHYDRRCSSLLLGRQIGGPGRSQRITYVALLAGLRQEWKTQRDRTLPQSPAFQRAHAGGGAVRMAPDATRPPRGSPRRPAPAVHSSPR